MAEITMQNGGVIKLLLNYDAAPRAVENFIKLANEGYYDGLNFHRIDPAFMIQGGCPEGTGRGGPGYGITGEFAINGWDNPISHTRGVISMARAQDYNSAGSQFFIVVQDSTFLDGSYAAFGHVTEGMDVVDRVAGAARNGETPLEPEVMESVRIIENEP
ncbi:MAG: peptidylprolyl isomerase [Clostridiales bacterium]|nr:peptidylprolyl isomerase [Clostridiales bacterium]